VVAIEDEIEAVLRELWVDRDRLEITVTKGEVTMAGEVENRSTALAIERHLGRIPGVVSLSPELRWQIDDRSHKVAAATARLGRRI
jgi:osmotically-inducible protein OsmY